MDYLDLKTKVQVLNFAFLDLGKTVIGRGSRDLELFSFHFFVLYVALFYGRWNK